MSNRRHPILTVLVIILVIALVLGSAMVIALNMLSPSSDLFFTEKIGIISVEGTISASQTVTSQLVKYRKDKGIKAIILKEQSLSFTCLPWALLFRQCQ